MGNLLRETPYSAITATNEVFDRWGVSAEDFKQIRSREDFGQRVSEFIRTGIAVKSWNNVFSPQELLGENFWGPEDWLKYFKDVFSDEQKEKLHGYIPEFPWNVDTLMNPCPFTHWRPALIKDTHFAFLGLETINGKLLTIIRFRELWPDDPMRSAYEPRFYGTLEREWYKGAKFTNETICGFRWYLLLKRNWGVFEDKNYEKQISLLPAAYEVPTAVEEMTKDILCFLKYKGGVMGRCVNEGRLVRCRDIVEEMKNYAGQIIERPAVGYSPQDYTLNIEKWGDSSSIYYLSLGASRKLP